jgi:hypothetical protein
VGVLVSLAIAPAAEGQEIEWARQFGGKGPANDLGYDVDADGNAYVVGVVYYGALPGQTSLRASDAFVRKYDSAGNEIWTRQFGTRNFDYALGISVDGSGVYVAGYTFGTLPGQTSQGGEDAFVRKYDADGNEVWTRQFGSSESDVASAISVDASGVYLTGWTNGALPGESNAGTYDVFVRKYDIAGGLVWTHQFGTTGYDNGRGICVDASGVYLTGRTL